MAETKEQEHPLLPPGYTSSGTPAGRHARGVWISGGALTTALNACPYYFFSIPFLNSKRQYTAMLARDPRGR